MQGAERNFRDGKLGQLFNLSGRTALVTGGNSGIGEAMAYGLGLAGARLLLVARREPLLRQTVEKFRAQGLETDYLVCDLTDSSALHACAKTALDRAGVIDILVNAAGFNLREPFMEVTDETWNKHFAIHVGAPFFLTQHVAPRMQETKWGRIINLASLQSYRAFPNSAPYGAAKGGVIQLTRAIAEEWSRVGVTCNAIAPGFFPTVLTERIFGESAKAAEAAAHSMIGRNGRLEDLYGVTVFLASDASSYITGQTIFVDGGFSAK